MSSENIEITDHTPEALTQILTPEALDFVAALHREFNPRRLEILKARVQRQTRLDAGERPQFLSADRYHDPDWRVAPTPTDLEKRWVEITGPVERKMMINALNSGADMFMADFEDALSPTWDNVIQGQVNLIDAVRKQIAFVSPEGKRYQLNDKIATLLVRPRGWHLTEAHVRVDGEPISASLFDFGLYLFHNARALLERGSGPYFYLPKLENHLEARLWNDVFNAAQDRLGLARGTIRATVLLETILAAFEMEDILYELREHSSGLNAGRWDYIFSAIKKFSKHSDIFPDRAQITMTVPFMRAYTRRLVSICHKRGAHAIGGMAAFIPSRRDEAVNAAALQKVTEDKQREARDGFDGTWVAHPDLVMVARAQFEAALKDAPHQKHVIPDISDLTPDMLIDFDIPQGQVTEAGFRLNINVALQYLNSWLDGNGAAAIHNLMEDAATAEISRAQLWQWVTRGASLAEGGTVTRELYERVRDEELEKLGGREAMHYRTAADLLDRLVLNPEFEEFLTLSAYPMLG